MRETDMSAVIAQMEPKFGPASRHGLMPVAVIGAKVIVRSRDAGVLYGEFAGNDGNTIRLNNARQLWKWFAAHGISLIDVATFGVQADRCKFSQAKATVTVFNTSAVIDVTEHAAASIEAVQ